MNKLVLEKLQMYFIFVKISFPHQVETANENFDGQ